jgi:hypothetical protein
MTEHFSIPASIEKIFAVYDANSNQINFNQDKNFRAIWFDTLPDGPLQVFGTPNKGRANLSAVVNAIDEDYEDILFQFIRANCAKQARDGGWKDELVEAERMVDERRQYRNRDSSQITNTMRFRDRLGRLVDSGSNEEQLTAGIPDYLVNEDL